MNRGLLITSDSLASAQQLLLRFHGGELGFWYSTSTAASSSGDRRLLRQRAVPHPLDEQGKLNVEERLRGQGVREDWARLLHACDSPKALQWGRRVHSQILRNGLERDISLCNQIVTMYAKCGSLDDARRMFDDMPERDVVSWNSMIATHVRYGNCKEAVRLFWQMHLEGIMPSKVTILSVLNACARMAAIANSKLIHSRILETPFRSDIAVQTAILNMYSKSGSLEDAQRIFGNMHRRNVVSWTAMIAAYSQHGDCTQALQLFHDMHLEGVTPNSITFLSILSAFACPASLAEGKLIHSRIVDSGFHSGVLMGTAIIQMYNRCGSVHDARRAFYRMRQRDVVCWNAMISACGQHGHGKEVFLLFQRMQQDGVIPDKATFVSTLNACANTATLAEGKMIHARSVESGLESDENVGTAIVNMYCKRASLEDARRTFNQMHGRSVITWTVMIAACIQDGHCREALELFEQMQVEGVMPDKVAFVAILNACFGQEALAEGKVIHARIVEAGFQSDIVVGTAIVDMYGKCGSLEDASKVFCQMQNRDVASWNSMLAVYVQHERCTEAFKLYEQMQLGGVVPNRITLVTILDACTVCSLLGEGKLVHAQIVESGLEADVFVGTSIVNMYGKCGSPEDARRVFDKLQRQDVILWNAMIAAYAQHGYGQEALQIFQQMDLEGVMPDDATFISLISACSHAGLVDEGFDCFVTMTGDHGITPKEEHYGCVIDLFGRSGRLDEAEEFIKKMPVQPSAVVWKTLLSACRLHGDVIRASQTAERSLEFEPQNSAMYVVLSNIYAATGNWNAAANVRKLMVDRGVLKEPGCSSIEVNNTVHQFVAGDRSHPETEEIYAELDRLCNQMEEAGYVPDTKMVLHDVEEQQREHLLSYHSEKLAIVFGLISTASGTPLQIINNLRVCGDCHTATKFISKIVGREIVVRDASRFHHFKDGLCSCGDFW